MNGDNALIKKINKEDIAEFCKDNIEVVKEVIKDLDNNSSNWDRCYGF